MLRRLAKEGAFELIARCCLLLHGAGGRRAVRMCHAGCRSIFFPMPAGADVGCYEGRAWSGMEAFSAVVKL